MPENTQNLVQNPSLVLFTIEHQPNGVVTFIEDRNLYSQGEYSLKDYIKSYKQVHDNAQDFIAPYNRTALAIIIKTADGRFLDANQNPIDPPTHNLPPLYTFTVAESNKAVILGMDIPNLEKIQQTDEDNYKAETLRSHCGLNKLHLYAMQLQTDLKLKAMPTFNIQGAGAAQAQKEYETEKKSIQDINNTRTYVAAGLLFLGIVALIINVLIPVILPATLFTIGVITSGILALVTAPIAPLILAERPLYFVNQDDRARALCHLYDEEHYKQLASNNAQIISAHKNKQESEISASAPPMPTAPSVGVGVPSAPPMPTTPPPSLPEKNTTTPKNT